MRDEALQVYLTALASSLTIGVIIPLMMLGLMVLAAWVVLARANRDPKFNIADVFRGPDNKVSSERVIFVATWASSTWALSVVLFAMPQHAVEVFVAYITVFALNDAAKRIAARKYGETTEPTPKGPE